MNVDHAERFEQLRATLVRHAYRMLGQYGDAEDAVQDAYLRWRDASEKTQIEDDKAYLRTTVTRLCLDRLRSARAKREVYVGPWLPEPVISNDVLAQTLGRSEPAVRKLASRARDHVRDENRRTVANRDELLRVRDALLQALQNEDAAALEQLLTEDVVFTSDGGGKVTAATVPVVGRDHVKKFLLGVVNKGLAAVRRIEMVTLNGLPGMVTLTDSGVQDAVALQIVDGHITAMYAIRNPDKLRTVAEQLS